MTKSFQRFAAGSAVLAAVASLVFTVAFSRVVQDGDRWAEWVSWTTLLIGSLVSVPVMTGLYRRLEGIEPEFALIAFVLGVAASIGAAVHAAYELSVLANPPGTTSDFPSAIDPRGFMTFALTGVALGLFGWLIVRGDGLPRSAGQLALAAAVLLLVVYVGRLTVLNPKTNVIRVAALMSGLVLVPGFYVQIGRSLLRDPDRSPSSSVSAVGVAS